MHDCADGIVVVVHLGLLGLQFGTYTVQPTKFWEQAIISCPQTTLINQSINPGFVKWPK